MGVLLLDSRDSFTWNLAHAFAEVGQRVVVEDSAGREPDLIQAQMKRDQLGLLCIGPGPRAPEHVEGLIPLLRALTGQVPIFGVCLGMQALALAFGGRVTRAKEPVHGKVREIEHDAVGLFAELPSPMRVMRYHSLVVDEVPARFAVTARCDDGQAMAIEARDANARAVQFHPESIGTAGGLQLLANVCRLAGNPAHVPSPRAGGIPPARPITGTTHATS